MRECKIPFFPGDVCYLCAGKNVIGVPEGFVFSLPEEKRCDDEKCLFFFLKVFVFNENVSYDDVNVHFFPNRIVRRRRSLFLYEARMTRLRHSDGAIATR